MRQINIATIDHARQRYETVGDWWFEGSFLFIRVSRMDNELYEAAVAIHELVEVMLCVIAGVTQAQVDEFDQAYEAMRQPGDTSEPGDSPDAPYRLQHCFATAVERLFIAAAGLSWKEYENKVNSL